MVGEADGGAGVSAEAGSSEGVTAATSGEAAFRAAPSGDATSSQREMMRLVAELYYVRELGQPEIAALTGFSVSKISRLLAAARTSGVVRISVEGAPSQPTPLARALAEALGVEVWVTPGQETAPALAARLCGVAAAPRLADELPESGGYRADGRVHRRVARGGAARQEPPRSCRRAAGRWLGFEQSSPEQQ